MYIKREDAIRYAQWEGAYKAVMNIEELPAEDVLPLSVVAEHIKNRLYETALNQSEVVAMKSTTLKYINGLPKALEEKWI